MTPQSKLIALAEWMGLKPNRKDCPCCGTPRTCALHVYLCPDERCECNCDPLPTLTLDWLHECYLKLSPEQKARFVSNLYRIVVPKAELPSLHDCFVRMESANKEQRSDALLKTIRKGEL